MPEGCFDAPKHLIWNASNLPQPLLQHSNLTEEFFSRGFGTAIWAAARGVKLMEYHSLPWRKHSFSQLSPADVEIRTGGGQFSPFQLSLLSLKCKFDNCDSRCKICASSTELRSWCEHNRNRCYIPEWLLERWAIPVDQNICG